MDRLLGVVGVVVAIGRFLPEVDGPSADVVSCDVDGEDDCSVVDEGLSGLCLSRTVTYQTDIITSLATFNAF
jgi:hypothetical protein